MNFCVNCAKRFNCNQKRCEGYMSPRQAKEDIEYKEWLKKEIKEMLEDGVIKKD